MASQLDEFSKALAGGVSRRSLLKTAVRLAFGGGVAALVSGKLPAGTAQGASLVICCSKKCCKSVIHKGKTCPESEDCQTYYACTASGANPQLCGHDLQCPADHPTQVGGSFNQDLRFAGDCPGCTIMRTPSLPRLSVPVASAADVSQPLLEFADASQPVDFCCLPGETRCGLTCCSSSQCCQGNTCAACKQNEICRNNTCVCAAPSVQCGPNCCPQGSACGPNNTCQTCVTPRPAPVAAARATPAYSTRAKPRRAAARVGRNVLRVARGRPARMEAVRARVVTATPRPPRAACSRTGIPAAACPTRLARTTSAAAAPRTTAVQAMSAIPTLAPRSPARPSAARPAGTSARVAAVSPQ